MENYHTGFSYTVSHLSLISMANCVLSFYYSKIFILLLFFELDINFAQQ